jgi:hypothetical protein
MLHSTLFGMLGLNIGWGLINLILSSKLAEYRLDNISVDGGMGKQWSSIRNRFTPANYSEQGRRLLSWLLASTMAQLITLVVWVLVFAE